MPNNKTYFFITPLLIILSFLIYFFILSSFKEDAAITPTEIPFYQKIPSRTKEFPTISLLFVGDIMLDRTIRKDGEQYGYENLFSCLKEEFSKHDEIVGNLEGTITPNKSVSRDAEFLSSESYRFTFDQKSVQALMDIGLSIVSIGNNHIRDFGDMGITQTIQFASSTGLGMFGNPQSNIERYLIKNIEGNRIAFISYNQFFGTKDETFEDLESAKKISDIQIIFAHWGDEYVSRREDTKNLAHLFVDSGADLIIGSHPHVVQESETYNETKIYYSLGNFIFDQYWEKSVREGLAVIVSIQNKKIFSTQELITESVRHKGTCFKKPPIE